MRLLLLLAVIGLAFILAPIESHARPQQERAAAVGALVRSVAGPNEPGLAVAVLIDGTVAARAVAGQADLEHGTAIEDATVFQAASLSKQFTAFAILLLEQEGKLSIDDPVSAYVPEAGRWPPITLRRLMDHTNGLRDLGTLLPMAGWQDEDLVTDQQALDMVLAQDALNFAPGTAFQYNNSDYVLLAEIVRRVSGQSMADFSQARIFGPLGMTHTRFQTELTTVRKGQAQSYEPAEEGFERRVLNHVYTGPTGLHTTAEDLLLWAANFESGQVGGPAVFRRMEVVGRMNDGTESFYPYALGQERRVYNGRLVWSHGGRTGGFRSFLLRIPGDHLAISVLSNRSDIDASAMAYRIADIYLTPTPLLAEPKIRPTTGDLAAYVGDYELFPGVFLNFSTDGEQLFLTVGGQPPAALPALSQRAFELNPRTGLSVTFDETVSGKSPGLKYIIGRNGALSAARVDFLPFAPASVRPEDYVGRYRSAELSTDYVFEVLDGDLVARHPRRPPMRMRAYQLDVFAGEEPLSRVRFKRDRSGRVTGFELSGPVAEGIIFVRAPS